MQRTTELELIDELLALKANDDFYLDDAVVRSPVSHYVSAARFDQERTHILEKLPLAVAHVSELAEPGDFLRRDVAGRSVLLTRDKQGALHAFLNACRHRGTQLVDDEAGCKHRFSCPYHAWTYANSGELIAAPHFDKGFTGLDKAELGLTRLDCRVHLGFVWVTVAPSGSVDMDAFIGALSPELAALDLDDMQLVHQDVAVHDANWKILAEGGIESYHFKIAHRDTIGPFFEDNLSSYRMYGEHMRSILMKSSMAGLTAENRDNWRLRDHAQVLYTLFPTTSLLVQSDHIALIQAEPLAADRTRMRLSTLAPKAEADRTAHWQRNHHITTTTLDEDFVIGANIQKTLAGGANESLIFGRFEGALAAFNAAVDARLPD